jgi:hypothetical protein
MGLLLTLAGCRLPTDTVVNRPPSVRLFIDDIRLPDSLRLQTRVRLFWTGSDADGYVRGFKIGWDASRSRALEKMEAALPVSRTDSTFLFSFNGGDTASVFFCISAVDDKEARSPEPAFIRIPLKNSRPVVTFQADGVPRADTVPVLISLPFAFSDPDGVENIRSLQIRINGNSWVDLPLSLTFMSLVPENPAPGETFAQVYAGENLATLNREPAPLPGIRIPGLLMGARNRIEIRVTDQAGTQSTDTLDKDYYFRPRLGEVLLVDAYRNETFVGDTLYPSLVRTLVSADRIDYTISDGINQPLFWNSTFYLLCRQYKSVFWYSDIVTNLPGLTPILLSTASASLNQYLRFNGKVLISAIFPDAPNQMSYDDPVFSLVPVKKFIPGTNLVRLKRTQPVLSRTAGFPDLLTTNNPTPVTGIDVFEPQDGADTLYFLPSSSVVNLTGPGMPIAVRTRNPFSNRTNMAFFAIELTNLCGNRQTLLSFFDRLYRDEFNW